MILFASFITAAKINTSTIFLTFDNFTKTACAPRQVDQWLLLEGMVLDQAKGIGFSTDILLRVWLMIISFALLQKKNFMIIVLLPLKDWAEL